MGEEKKVLAVDLGAGSGKVFVASFDGSRCALHESFRFSNAPVRLNGRLCNDTSYLYDQILKGILASAEKTSFCSVGVDTWGNDYAFIGQDGSLMRESFNYRDERTIGFEELDRFADKRAHYAITGIPSVRTCAYGQLVVDLACMQDGERENIRSFLQLADYFAYCVTGEISSEYSITSTSSLVDVRSRNWAPAVQECIPLTKHAYPPMVEPGRVIGPVREQVLRSAGLRDLLYVKPASHDTGSAVACIPCSEEDFLYMSCGSMLLIGVEAARYCTNDKAFAGDFHNQGSPSGRMRIQKSVQGLWLIHRCMQALKKQDPSIGYDTLEQMAEAAEPFARYINVHDKSFALPDEMPERIAAYCRSSGQSVPSSTGELIRCVYESLAVKAAAVIMELEDIFEKRFPCIYVQGGGTQSRVFMQMIADATGKEIHVGFENASAMGNALMQLHALGEIDGLKQIRQVARQSIEGKRFIPCEGGRQRWQEMFAKGKRIDSLYDWRKEL